MAPSHNSTNIPLIIDGKEVHTSVRFPVISPNTSQKIWECSAASKANAIAAADAAARAFPAWSKSSVDERRRIFLKAADIIEERVLELQSYMRDETGSDDDFTMFIIGLSTGYLRDIAGRISAALTGSIPVCSDEGRQALVLKEPYGVVLGIAPWNAPYVLGIRSVAFAIAGGNTCIMKGSETSPCCHSVIGSIFKDAGLPDGVLNTVYHRPEDAEEITTTLIEHPAVQKINFTGSSAVGSIVSAIAGKNLKPILTELGGKASAIVCEDADIEKAAAGCAAGAFLHKGQICMSTERILVHNSIVEPFSKALKDVTARVYNSPLTVAQKATVGKNKKLITEAVSKGAKLLYGDFDLKEKSDFHMRPIIISDITKEMSLYDTESFGPSVSLITISSDDEAVQIANDTQYGLSGAVFTENLARGLSIARRINSGAIHINSMTVHDEAVLPHGGVKRSGFGRFNAQFGFDEFLKTKTITFQV